MMNSVDEQKFMDLSSVWSLVQGNLQTIAMHTSSLKTWVVRSSIFIGMATAVMTILWLDPIPQPYFLPCDRPCHELEWPMICRFKLTLEVYQTFSRSCGDCPRNVTDCLRNNCVTGDGYERGILAANRQIPGPSIQVCQNDILVIDVVNRIPGHSLSVHWRGMGQRDTPFMDGVPMVTQCPIPTYTTFQYKFRASRSGTHLWHAHNGIDTADGIFGTLIVREAATKDPHRSLYDVDDPSHVITVSEWTHGFAIQRLVDARGNSQGSVPDALLVNGRGKAKKPDKESTLNDVPYTTFIVTPNVRHRFRLAHTGVMSCPIRLSIDGHPLLLIAMDGNPIEAKEVSSVVLSSGERADFVLQADKQIGTYWLRVVTLPDCPAPKPLLQGAIVRYKGAAPDEPKGASPLTQKAKQSKLPEGVVKHCDSDDNALCYQEIPALDKLPPELSGEKMDVQIYLAYDFKRVRNENISVPTFLLSRDKYVEVPQVNNLTFMFPPSPMLTQPQDVPADLVCNKDSVPAKCLKERDGGDICECVHQVNVPLGSTVELMLIDQGRGGDKNHVFHLHGYAFYIVAAQKLGRPVAAEEVENLEKTGQIERNLVNPLLKDTVAVPNKGFVALRFKATQAGYWLLEDQHLSHSTRGLNVILHVGTEAQLPRAPYDFPKCGSFRGPDFFLA